MQAQVERLRGEIKEVERKQRELEEVEMRRLEEEKGRLERENKIQEQCGVELCRVERAVEQRDLRVSYWGHKISKSTSVDCNKIYVVTV